MAANPDSFDRKRNENNRRFDEARRQVEIGVARHKIERDELLRALPAELRAYVEGQITIGATTRRLDYLSPRRGVEIKRVSSNKFMAWHSASPALLNLAVARGIADHGLRPPRDYTLILVNEGVAPLGNSSMQRVMFDAGVLGISVYQVHSFAQAGELIAQLETEGEDGASDIDLDIEPPPDHDPSAE